MWKEKENELMIEQEILAHQISAPDKKISASKFAKYYTSHLNPKTN